MDLFKFDENEKNNKTGLNLNIRSYDFVIGCDEAGRGPAAGGVWAAAVCFKKDTNTSNFIKLNDSKKLTSKTRDELYETIKESSIWSIKAITIEKIEQINILNASLLAMKYAAMDVINQINQNNILTLVDGNKLIKEFNNPQKYIIKGDSKSASIAAASILAKVSRDRYMLKLDEEFPQYNWKENAGYLTKEHMSLIDKYGLCKYHRPSYLQKHFAKQEQLNLF